MSATPVMRMIGKSALVTGAASGIGKATARRLADEGATVVLADLNQPELARVADDICADGGKAFAFRMEVTSEEDWQTGMARILAECGRLDICVNCAGIACAHPITDMTLADWRRVMATNLDGAFLGTRQALIAMKDRGGGCIINIASAAGIKPVSGNAAYGASKAAIRFLTRVAALEGAPHRVRVNSISPGAVATPMWESTDLWPKQIAQTEGQDAALKALMKDHGFADPREIAAAVLFLAGDEARQITGTDLVVDAGFAIS